MKRLVSLILLLSLAACGGNGYEDLEQFVKNSGNNLRGKVDPLPEVKPYQPFTYAAFDLPDPFKPRKLRLTQGGGGLQPDMNRPKEPLESYSLESLKMVGVLKQKGKTFAVIKAPDNAIYRIHSGNHIGQNFGLVTAVNDTAVKIKEIVQDSAGDWAERESNLTLQEQ
ncbi:pilus biosynthesis protein PilP [Sulfuriferula plumbiphila]|uniref:Pilus biosynthesis protein PilP n=1 Tax=Sulfuriferula plumbiphila TaxID=171865 RepID=A0A512L851_9PROT|nr:pilus assembly protein PilP [Sulfuriferula plumbiphila]BBP05646.1 pilus biosynthesis protein PilP [Sulfuriferula plumbiphila]GEP30647.1 pilus biosynthesis protein PilP [Sulfuriferula plumbiphila]